MFSSSVSLTRLIRALLPCVCALPLLVQAADKAKESSFGKAPPKSPLLSRNELRECMALQEKNRSTLADTSKLQTQLGHDKDEIVRLAAELKETLVWLDQTSAEQVDQYNAKAAARTKLIEAYEARVPAYNAQVDALKASRDAFAKNCENRRFDERDEADIKSGK